MPPAFCSEGLLEQMPQGNINAHNAFKCPGGIIDGSGCRHGHIIVDIILVQTGPSGLGNVGGIF